MALAEEIDLPDLARIEADVVILGEVHDNPAHHINQATAIAALRPGAIVFEMFGPDEANAAMSLPRHDAGALAAALGWTESGWPDFALYHPIFLAAPDAALYGGALPRGEVRRAVEEGAAAVFGAASPLFGLDAALPEDQQTRREALQMAAHCDALPEHVLPGMVEAQRLRDAALSRAIVAAMLETGGPVAVITGNGHARTDWGIPPMLAGALPDASVLSLGQLESAPNGPAPYDLWIVTDPVERPDPCAAFGQQ
ncbi:ChaN family lipoprotein [Ovoidimarina sediminis]|uniref:ChaN family lipoprotein n=1 Tax=Ovoidimarina sediminis TaxID=3079856 RepID=UPI0029071F2A|nr:ChaN family lipoprotein [Rhodophyticola sp. MJ-SS7]MDU8943713.1 ChaN family lipoprotein [Rhodophyticola sp. MJ-SS7]